jgi:signal transduction histidine kinase
MIGLMEASLIGLSTYTESKTLLEAQQTIREAQQTIRRTIEGYQEHASVDEAKAAGLTTANFPQITADIFKPMDGGIDLSPEEIMGRNTWNL